MSESDFFSAKPPSVLGLGHRAVVWLVGIRMVGFMLSGSRIRVSVLGNLGFGPLAMPFPIALVGWSDQFFLSKKKLNKKCSLIVVTIRSITVVVSCICVKY